MSDTAMDVLRGVAVGAAEAIPGASSVVRDYRQIKRIKDNVDRFNREKARKAEADRIRQEKAERAKASELMGVDVTHPEHYKAETKPSAPKVPKAPKAPSAVTPTATAKAPAKGGTIAPRAGFSGRGK